MANPIIVNHATDEDFRHELARTSVCEVADIVDVLNEQSGDLSPNLWRGMYRRLNELLGVAISALDDGADTADLADIVYGENGWVVSEGEEARHA